MLRAVKRRYFSSGLDVFLEGHQRYRLLSEADRRKLLGAHRLKNVPDSAPEKRRDGRNGANESHEASEAPEPAPAARLIANELRRLKSRSHGFGRSAARARPLGAGVSKFFMGIDPNTEPEHYDITTPLFEPANETATLVSDVQKAAAYDDVQAMLSALRPVPQTQDRLTDRFVDVMARAIEANIARVERPVLFNELSDYVSSYAMQRAALRNLLVNRCTRNAFEETRVERFLDRLRFSQQRLNAPLPPEVLEPLVAFRGYTSYSFDPCIRLSQKLGGIQRFVSAVVNNDTAFLRALGTPEECPVGPPTKYPFANYYGFKSCVPSDVTGSIRMGKPEGQTTVRYHNLQAVAHSLPQDRKYRAVVMHAIRVLERSKGWDHASKVKAINRLVQVYNNLAPSRYYARVLDQAIPLETFNRGLTYIQSLTRNHWMKRK